MARLLFLGAAAFQLASAAAWFCSIHGTAGSELVRVTMVFGPSAALVLAGGALLLQRRRRAHGGFALAVWLLTIPVLVANAVYASLALPGQPYTLAPLLPPLFIYLLAFSFGGATIVLAGAWVTIAGLFWLAERRKPAQTG